MNNCTNPPHFPPHCGCPAGFTVEFGKHGKTEDNGGDEETRGGHDCEVS